MGVNFTTVLIAAGDADARYRLQLALAQMPGVVAIGDASDGETAVQKACDHTPDILVMDIAIPGLAGLEVIRRVKSAAPSVKVLIYTAIEPAGFALAALRAGASGYCLEGVSRPAFVTAIEAVKAGAIWLDARVASRILNLMPAPNAPKTKYQSESSRKTS